MKMKYQYEAAVQQRAEDTWWNAKLLSDQAKSLRDRFFATEDEAVEAIRKCIEMHRPSSEERRETTEIGNSGLGCTLVEDIETQKRHEIVAWKVRRRQVSEWEDVQIEL